MYEVSGQRDETGQRDNRADQAKADSAELKARTTAAHLGEYLMLSREQGFDARVDLWIDEFRLREKTR